MNRRRWLAVVLLVAWGIWSWVWFFPPRPRVGPLGSNLVGALGPVLIFAPHSDDEALATAGIIQQAEEQGGAPRVVLVTGGDAFTWSAKAYFKRLTLKPGDMLTYGSQRVVESRTALERLGLPPERLIFLGFPDKEINNLWTRCWRRSEPCAGPYTQVSQVTYAEARAEGTPFAGEALLEQFIQVLKEVRPALVVYPHPNDAHVDHWGTSNFVTAALEQLRRIEPDWQPPKEWLYIVHRGDWPAPKGYRPHDSLLPPEKLAKETMTSWHEVPLTPEQVGRKYQAVEAYKTQTQVLHRYMHSFIRSNELYGTMERLHLTPVAAWGEVASDQTDPAALTEGVPPWTGLTWQMAIADPHADTVAREVQRGADLLRVWVANDGEYLYLAARTSAAPANRVAIRFAGRSYTNMAGWGPSFAVAVSGKGRYEVLRWPTEPTPAGIRVASTANWSRIDLPLESLGLPAAVMVNAEAWYNTMMIDRTAWRLISLDGS